VSSMACHPLKQNHLKNCTPFLGSQVRKKQLVIRVTLKRQMSIRIAPRYWTL
ncbi:hypothetical protein ACJMK2_002003, partial [Sinanodonta woodiana]